MTKLLEPNPDAFVRWLTGQEVDGWLYTGGWENYPQQIEQMAQLRPLLGNQAKSLRSAKDAHHLACTFAAHGLHFPPTQSIPPTEGNWLIKSPTSTGGLGVDDWKLGATVPESASESCYWQQKIEGRAISAAYVAAGQRCTLLGVTEQLIGRPWTYSQPYHYAGSVGPLIEEGALAPQLAHVGEVVARECGLVGLYGIDFVLDTGGRAWAVDVNPRYTASMEVVERFAKVNMVEAHVAACTEGKLPSVTPVANRFFGKAYLFATREVKFRRPAGMELADLPAEGFVVSPHHPICTLLADAGEYDTVERSLELRAGELETYLYSNPL